MSNIFKRKRIETVTAIRFDGENYKECDDFIGKENYDNTLTYPNIITPEWIGTVEKGNWIIKDFNGKFSVCSNNVFEKTWMRM